MSAALEAVPDDGGRHAPPNDVEAERCVLGSLMLSASVLDDVAPLISGRDFYRPAHETIWEAITGLASEGNPFDAVAVADRLDANGDLLRIGGPVYVHTLLSSVPTAASGGYYARIVADKAVRRRVIDAGTRIARLGYTSTGDEALNLMEAEVLAANDRTSTEDYRAIGMLLDETFDEIEAAGKREQGVTGVPTGFIDLDKLTSGLHAGQLILVAGRPAMGKSCLGMDLCRSASIHHGLTSVMFSLEMGRSDITTRLLSAEAKVQLQNIRKGNVDEIEWAALARARTRLDDAPFFIDDSPNLTLADIRSKVRRLKQKNDLRLVVIDYLQLMTSGKKVESRQQEVSEFSRALKLLAKEVEVPIVALSQLNRGPEQRQDKTPQASDLRESGCLTRETTLLRADTGAPVSFGELMDKGWEGVSVWSLDDDRKIVAAPITNVFPSGVKQTFKMLMASGRTVTATDTHKFRTLHGWTALGDLVPGSRLAIPRAIPAPMTGGLGWSTYRLGLLAHLLGDGCVLTKQPVHYTSEDEENIRFVTEAAAEFGITPRRVAQGNWWHVYLPAPAAGRNPISNWFREMGIGNLRSHEKHLPAELFGMTNAEVCTFLRHLWATDGRVAEPSSMASGIAIISYATTSRRLADDVALLLARLGIVARIKVVPEERGRVGYRVTIADAGSMRIFCESIGVHGARGVRADRLLSELVGKRLNPNKGAIPREMWDEIRSLRAEAGMTERAFQSRLETSYCGTTLYKTGLSRERMGRAAEILNSDDLRGFASDDVFWDEVVSIIPAAVVPVFDATVKGTHSFIADGIVAHNSLEQDADLIILLHRPDVYEKESPRAGEADLIVAKHRNGPTETLKMVFQGHYSRFADMADDWTPPERAS